MQLMKSVFLLLLVLISLLTWFIGFRQLIQFMITNPPCVYCLENRQGERKSQYMQSLERPWEPFAKMREWKP